MNDFNDPLDIIDNGDHGAIELSLLEEEEEEKQERQVKRGSGKNNSGCSVILFLIGSTMIVVGWIVSQFI